MTDLAGLSPFRTHWSDSWTCRTVWGRGAIHVADVERPTSPGGVDGEASAGMTLGGKTPAAVTELTRPASAAPSGSFLTDRRPGSPPPASWVTREWVPQGVLGPPRIHCSPHLGGRLGNTPPPAVLPASRPPPLPASPSPATSTPHGNLLHGACVRGNSTRGGGWQPEEAEIRFSASP